MGKAFKKIIIILGILLIAFVVLIAGGRMFFMNRMINMSPEKKERFEHWNKAKIKIDINKLQPKEIPTSYTQTSKNEFAEKSPGLTKSEDNKSTETIFTLWEKHKDNAGKIVNNYQTFRREGKSDSEILNQEEFKKSFDTLAPLIDYFSKTVEQADYSIDDLVDNTKNQYGIPFADYYLAQTCVKLLGIKSLYEIESGKEEQSIETCADICRAANAPYYGVLIEQLISIAIRNIGAEYTFKAIEKCKNPDVVLKSINFQKAYKVDIALNDDKIDIQSLDSIGAILKAKKAGIKTNIENKTSRELAAESFRVQAEYMKTFVLPKYANNDYEKQRTQQSIDGFYVTSAVMGGEAKTIKAALAKIIAPAISPMLFSIAEPNFMEANIRAKVASVKADIVLFNSVKKYIYLQEGRNVDEFTPMFSKLIGEINSDPFANTDSPYQTKPEFHSIGPDKTDQSAEILYDPSNGTVSSGDIFAVNLN